MPRFDLSPAELAAYLPEVRRPADFDDFWDRTLAESRAVGGDVTVTAAASPFTTVDVFDVTFPGFAGDPIKAWLVRPRGVDGPLPAVVEFIGYGGGRGAIGEKLTWASAGYAHFVMDTRGQGAGWGTGGATADPHGTGASASGFMTRGIEDPETYYYRRLYIDAARAVDAVRAIDGIDPARVSVVGASQGGGLAIAAAGLSDGLVAALPEVPFLCHFERAVGFTDRDPYAEIARYLSVHRGAEEQVFDTLSYFDGVNLAARATAPTLFSVALMDFTCPPSTVYAAYNRWGGADKDIVVYPFNDHEGGQILQFLQQTAFLAARG